MRILRRTSEQSAPDSRRGDAAWYRIEITAWVPRRNRSHAQESGKSSERCFCCRQGQIALVSDDSINKDSKKAMSAEEFQANQVLWPLDCKGGIMAQRLRRSVGRHNVGLGSSTGKTKRGQCLDRIMGRLSESKKPTGMTLACCCGCG